MTDRYTDYENVNVRGSIKSTKQGIVVGSLTTMPTASQEYVGQIIVYKGATTQNYTTNRSYECQEVSTGVYAWVDSTPSQELNLTQNKVVVSDQNGDLTSATATTTEVNYLSGVTSNVQTQLGNLNTQVSGKQPQLTSQNAGTNITISGSGDNVVISQQAEVGSRWGIIGGDIDDQTDLNSTFQKKNVGTASRAIVSDANGIITVSDVTQTEVGYLDGVTSNIQTQINTVAGDLSDEVTARGNADTQLQDQIDALTSKSDVVDVVQTYSDLQSYDTSALGNNDIVKVLDDSQHGDQESYYRWVKASTSSDFASWDNQTAYAIGDVVKHNGVVYTCKVANTGEEPTVASQGTYWTIGTWIYIGSLSASYTKQEEDALLLGKMGVDMTNASLGQGNSGKYLKVTQTGGVTYDIPSTDISGKADVDLTNVNVGSGNADKYLQVSSTGALQYSNVDMSSKADTDLTNVSVSTADQGKYLKVTSEGGITYDNPPGATYYAGDGLNLASNTFTPNTSYVSSGKNYKVDVDSTTKGLYVNVPWTDTVTTVSTSGDGNAITAISASDGQITATKGATFLTTHQSVTDGDPTLQWGTRSKVATVGSTDIHVTMPANPDTTYSAGDGLVLTGTTFTPNTSFTTQNKDYAVQVDSTTKGLYVNVPWTDNNTTYSAGDGLVLDGTTFKPNVSYTTSGKNYAIQVDSTSKGLYVNVPWTDTTYSNGSGLKLSSGTFSVNTDYTTQGKNYAVKVDSTTGGLYANVPWENTTYTNGSGLKLSSGTFLVNTDYITSGKNYKVQVDSTTGGLYVNVPWTDTVTTASTSGDGNAVTSITASNGQLTITKGSTFATTSQLSDGSVTKVGTSTVGGATTPIYLNAGVPTQGTALSDGAYKAMGSIASENTGLVTGGAIYTAVSAKQDTLVSGTNIKTINGSSVLGSGNIAIDSGAEVWTISSIDSSSATFSYNGVVKSASQFGEYVYSNYTDKDICVAYNETDDPEEGEKDAHIFALDYAHTRVEEEVSLYEVVFKKHMSYYILILTIQGNRTSTGVEYLQQPITAGTGINIQYGNTISTDCDATPTSESAKPVSSGGVYTALSSKQDTLVSGTNIKTVNNQSILGSGDINANGFQVTAESGYYTLTDGNNVTLTDNTTYWTLSWS